VVAIAIVVFLSLIAGAGEAGADSIGSGRTTVMLSRGFDAQLEVEGIHLQAIHRRPTKTRTVTLAIGSGSLAADARGYLIYRAAIRFAAGKRSVLFRKLNLDTEHRSLNGTVGKRGRREISIAAAPVGKAWQEGFEIGFSSALSLSPEAARLLNARLRPERRFQPGQRLGRAVTIARPLAVSVTGGSQEFVLTDPFAAKLDALGVTTTAYEVGTKTAESPPTFALPLIQGLVSPSLLGGGAFTEGGLQFSRGEDAELRQVEFGAVWMNLESAQLRGHLQTQESSLPGEVALAGLDLGAAIRSADPSAGLLRISGATATLSPELAASLNHAFAAPDDPQPFAVGEPFATVAATMETRD